jgi:copper(I)-binding protein
MISQTAQQVPAVDGASGDAGHISVRDALLATPDAANYPQGSDVAVQLVLVNNGAVDDSLTGVTSPVAGSEKLSGEVKVPAGSSVTIGGDSEVTAVLTGINRALCYGQAFPLTFSFAQAGQLTLDVPIQIPAERTGTRPTIDIQPPEGTPLWETGHAAAEAHGEASAPASAGGSPAASAAPGSACTAAPAPSAG